MIFYLIIRKLTLYHFETWLVTKHVHCCRVPLFSLWMEKDQQQAALAATKLQTNRRQWQQRARTRHVHFTFGASLMIGRVRQGSRPLDIMFGTWGCITPPVGWDQTQLNVDRCQRKLRPPVYSLQLVPLTYGGLFCG